MTPARWKLLLTVMARLPQGALSRVTGRAADLRLPRPIRARLLRVFAQAAGIETGEAEHPLEAYETLNAFFVRRLRPGARSWPADPSVITSPVDGVVGQFGIITDGRLIQAKGRVYSAQSLLEDSAAHRFHGGTFVTLYLSPRHYHRVHSPMDGAVVRARHVPGTLFPVNRPALDSIDALFARNERIVLWLESAVGSVGLVAVGACNVGRITVAFEQVLRTNRKDAVAVTRNYDPTVRVRRGDELMTFHLGSTVILLFEPGRITMRPGLEMNAEIRLGEPLAVSTS